MADLFVLTNDIKAIAESAVNALISQLGKDCRLVYPPRWTSCSNCWTAGTPISTPNGPVPIEELNPGDIVWGPNAIPRKVTGAFSALYNGVLVRLGCRGAKSDDWVTADHRFPVIRKLRKQYTQKQWLSDHIINPRIELVRAADIEVGDALLMPVLPVRDNELTDLDMGRFGRFPCTDTLLHFLGWWIAEGCWGDRVASFCLCASKEEYIAQSLLHVAKAELGLTGRLEYRSDADNLLVHLYSKKLCDYLLMFGHGAENKQIPSVLWSQLSTRQLLVMFHGYFLGDGHREDDPTHSIYAWCSTGTTSKHLAAQCWELLHSLGWLPDLTTMPPKRDKNGVNHKRYWTVSWRGERKQRKSNMRWVGNGWASIVDKIEKREAVVPVYNLEVEQEHEYLVNGVRTCNCIFDPIGNKSSNRWINGGPIPFPNGQPCPLCNGKGMRAEEVSETIRMLVAWEPAHFFIKPYPYPVQALEPTRLQIPDGVIQTKGHIADMPKVLKARQMVLQPPVEPYIRYRFDLAGEPAEVGNIVQNKFFVSIWRRSG